jgi:hypothetical protein
MKLPTVLLAIALVAGPSAVRGADETAELTAALQDSAEDVRWLAADLLGDPGVDAAAAVRALMDAVFDETESWRVRAAAASSLGEIARRERRRAVRTLWKVARDESSDWRVRLAAIEGLWAVDEGRLLLAGLADSHEPLVIETTDSVVVFGDHRALVADHAGTCADRDPRVKRLAAKALAVNAKLETLASAPASLCVGRGSPEAAPPAAPCAPARDGVIGILVSGAATSAAAAPTVVRPI